MDLSTYSNPNNEDVGLLPLSSLGMLCIIVPLPRFMLKTRRTLLLLESYGRSECVQNKLVVVRNPTTANYGWIAQFLSRQSTFDEQDMTL